VVDAEVKTVWSRKHNVGADDRAHILVNLLIKEKWHD
jgi:hypothetical protein